MNLKEEMNVWQKCIEEYMNDIVPTNEVFPNVIYDAMRYSLLSEGKRLRPMLLLAANKAFGGDTKEALPFAAAIEMIHNYSLIHDDLPAMDNDDYRRGRLTNHKVFGEDMAILAGDGLLHFSMQVMSRACLSNINERFVKAMNVICECAGTDGMLVGQVADVFYEGKEIDGKILEFIHLNKTAKMIASPLKAGAIIGGASDDMANRLYLAGEKIGVAFQIIDDILDVTSTSEELGKPIHSDEKNNKTTYVTLYGVEKSKEIAKQLSDEAVLIFSEMGVDFEFLKELSIYLTDRRK